MRKNLPLTGNGYVFKDDALMVTEPGPDAGIEFGGNMGQFGG